MSDERIRSYQRAYTPELLLHSIGDLQLWRPVPARGILYAAILELLMFCGWHLIGTRQILGALGWEITFLLIPLGLAALLSLAKIEGRRFHVAFRARAEAFRTARYLAGGWWPVEPPGGRESYRGPKVKEWKGTVTMSDSDASEGAQDELDDDPEWACTHCNGEGLCWDGADPLDDCPDRPHPCHACYGSGRREDQVIF